MARTVRRQHFGMRRTVPAYDGGVSRDLSVIGHALAAPVRSRILNLLMDGSSRPASELAAAAGVGGSTASEHLGVLLDAGLLSCVPHGRHRFYSIADPEVAGALELLGHLCPAEPAVTRSTSSAARDLVHARLCYDHLAGRLGVHLADAMIASAWVDADASGLTPAGAEHLGAQGIDIDAIRARRRPLVRPCPDWTERRPHLAGSVGAAVATLFLDRRWATRRPSGRGLDLTDGGLEALCAVWNVRAPLTDQP
jgi:DNA-binding transcriptional ArsR family regulator